MGAESTPKFKAALMAGSVFGVGAYEAAMGKNAPFAGGSFAETYTDCRRDADAIYRELDHLKMRNNPALNVLMAAGLGRARAKGQVPHREPRTIAEIVAAAAEHTKDFDYQA